MKFVERNLFYMIQIVIFFLKVSELVKKLFDTE